MYEARGPNCKYEVFWKIGQNAERKKKKYVMGRIWSDRNWAAHQASWAVDEGGLTRGCSWAWCDLALGRLVAGAPDEQGRGQARQE